MYDKPLFHPLIWVEGIIGAGKSTFCEEIASRLGLDIYEEPVETNPYLGDFYLTEEHKKKAAFPMQIWLAFERLAVQQKSSWGSLNKGAMIDRSISGDRVFAKLLWQAGYIDDRDWDSYNKIHRVVARMLCPPTLIVFLDIQPETAKERVEQRARAAEIEGGAGVDLGYLQALRDGYLELLEEAQTGLLPWGHAVRVERIPWDVDTVTPAQWDRVAQTVAGACRRMGV